MKVNEAPEKIYLQVCGDCNQVYCDNCKFEDLEDNVTWCKDRIFPKDIEYTRTDAFIEKAAEWLMENVEKHISADGEYTVYYNEMVEDFKKAMKGE